MNRIHGEFEAGGEHPEYGQGWISGIEFLPDLGSDERVFVYSGFGAHEEWRKAMNLGPHPGSDWNYARDDGGRILAPWDGYASKVCYGAIADFNGGNWVEISTLDDSQRIGFYHLQDGAEIEQGQKVRRNQTLVGHGGCTGHACEGPHHHINYKYRDDRGIWVSDNIINILTAESGQLLPEITLNEVYRWVTDGWDGYQSYDGQWDSRLEIVQPDDGWDQQVVLRRKRTAN